MEKRRHYGPPPAFGKWSDLCLLSDTLNAFSSVWSIRNFRLFTILAFDAELQLERVICETGQCYLHLFHMYVIPSRWFEAVFWCYRTLSYVSRAVLPSLLIFHVISLWNTDFLFLITQFGCPEEAIHYDFSDWKKAVTNKSELNRLSLVLKL